MPIRTCTALLFFLVSSALGKKVGLHEHASDKFKEHLHDKIIEARVQVIG